MAEVNSVTLLLDPDRRQSVPAANYAREFFDVKQVQWHKRDSHTLREPCERANYLFNFLSAPFVPLAERMKFEAAINFHPAPPEYPGVGSASRALYDRRMWHGVTAHLMDDQYDHGLILRVRRFPIHVSWGYQDLFEYSLEQSLSLFVDMCRQLSQRREELSYSGDHWSGKAMTRAQFEKHPSFMKIPKEKVT